MADFSKDWITLAISGNYWSISDSNLGSASADYFKDWMFLMNNILTKKFAGFVYIGQFDAVDSSTHSHEYLELAYVKKGSGITTINGKTEKLQKGDFYIIDFNSYHSYKSVESGFSIINCLFSPQLIDYSFPDNISFNELLEAYFFKISNRRLTVPTSNCVYHGGGDIGDIFEKMLAEYRGKKEGYFELIRHCVCEIIIKIARTVGSEKILSEHTDRVIEVVKKHYSDDISLKNIAADLHYSLPYLSAEFRRETGMTFTSYLQKTRVENAAFLLTSTDMPIVEIAEQSGYNDLKTFYAVFKRLLNITPNEYRKRNVSK